MINLESLKNNKDIKNILEQYGVKYIAVFGSVAEGTNTIDSDLDLIVEFASKRNLFKMIELSQKLSEILGVKVDLVTKDSISKYLKDRVEQEKVVIYEKMG